MIKYKPVTNIPQSSLSAMTNKTSRIMETHFNRYWGHMIVDNSGTIQFINRQGSIILGHTVLLGKNISQVLPWLRKTWLTDDPAPRLVKTSISEKLLLDILIDSNRHEWFHIFFRRLNDYNDTEHLWCEVADSIIGVQTFIDTSYDGMVVENGQGIILAVNTAFLRIAGLTKEALIGKQIQELIEKGLVPHTCSLQALQQKKTCSIDVKYTNGREAVVSSTPLCGRLGKVIRIISNVRDISALNKLHAELKNVDNQTKRPENKLKTIPFSNLDMYTKIIRSHKMERLYKLIPKIANTDLQLLITGESGVGKTALAKYIHAVSERNNRGAFIHVNCSAIPDTLLESELFGYEEGAFTGAKRLKAGLFELADQGTLFLDEIGDMPLHLQAKILNVLQESKFYRVGGAKELTVDVRIIAATNMNLEQLVAKGTFRQDLYYRLNVIPLRIPSLAERKEDIPLLIAYYLDKCQKQYRTPKTLSPEVMDILLKYNWPGNIRELINLIERMVVLVDAPVIQLKDLTEVDENLGLPVSISSPGKTIFRSDSNKKSLWQPNHNLKDIVRTLEKEIIEEAVLQCGSLKSAANNLGVDVTTLTRKINKAPHH